jgi:hypothetical protein
VDGTGWKREEGYLNPEGKAAIGRIWREMGEGMLLLDFPGKAWGNGSHLLTHAFRRNKDYLIRV